MTCHKSRMDAHAPGRMNTPGYKPQDAQPKVLSQPWIWKPKDCCSAVKATAEKPSEGQMDCGPTHCNMVGMSLGRCCEVDSSIVHGGVDDQDPLCNLFILFTASMVLRQGMGKEGVTTRRGQSCSSHHCPHRGSWWRPLLWYFVFLNRASLFYTHFMNDTQQTWQVEKTCSVFKANFGYPSTAWMPNGHNRAECMVSVMQKSVVGPYVITCPR